MKSLIINIGNNKTLSKIVQELLFEAGYSWASGSKEVILNYDDAQLVTYPEEQMSIRTCGSQNKRDCTIINASTEIGKLIELLEKKEIIVEAVAIEGLALGGLKKLDGKISADKRYMNVGCCSVSREKVKEVHQRMLEDA